LELLIEPDTYHHFPRGEVIMRLTSTMLKRLIAEEVEEFRVRREVRRALREANEELSMDDRRVAAAAGRTVDQEKKSADLTKLLNVARYSLDPRAKMDQKAREAALSQGVPTDKAAARDLVASFVSGEDDLIDLDESPMPPTVEGFLRARRRR
jgi:hypothetical protein